MEEVKVGDLTIRPSLKVEIKEIHPAIGVVDDTAYVGIWVPSEIVGKKGEVAFKDLLYLVTDKRETILANDEVLRHRGWRLTYKPIKFENRWSLRHVQAYLKGATVDPCRVFNHVLEAWMEYMELPSWGEYIYHVLWDMGTYFHCLFNAYPYHFIGAVKRCGKTKDLMLHSCLAFNAFFSNNMSTSSIYRLIQNARGTLLIDETEKLSQPDRALEFRSILLAGYKKGEKVYRVEKTRKEMLQPEAFEVYSPKALANIQGLEDVLEDRCKITILKKSRNKQIINKEVEASDPRWSELRDELYVFYLMFWREIKAVYDKISELGELSELVNFVGEQLPDPRDMEFLVGRELEIWKAILALALFLDGKGCVLNKFTSSLSSPSSLTLLMLRLAVEGAKQRHTEDMTETGEAILAQVLLKLVTKDDYYKVKDIKDEMAALFDEEQKWLTTRWIGNALRRLGFKEKRRVGTGYQYLLSTADVEDLAKRLGLPLPILFSDKFSKIKEWILSAKDQDSLVEQSKLAAKCVELELDPQRIVEKLKEEGFLSEAPNIGKFVVNGP